jgi:hypothetical protein
MVLGDTNAFHRYSCSSCPARSLDQQELSGSYSFSDCGSGLCHRVWVYQASREGCEEDTAAASGLSSRTFIGRPSGRPCLRLVLHRRAVLTGRKGTLLRIGLRVTLQGQGINTNASTVAAAAFTAAAQSGPFNIFTFSGGAQATMNALALVSPQVRGLVNNITFLSPGVGGSALGADAPLPTGTGTTTVLEGTSFLDTMANQSLFGGGSTGCGHSANCAFTNNSAQLHKLAGGGSGCNSPSTFVPKGSLGGIQISGPYVPFVQLVGDDGTSVTTTQVDELPLLP